jgi:transaldolase
MQTAERTDESIFQAARLFDLLGLPNVLIKIPATVEGLPAIRASIAAGINVNVTLIFSIARYREVVDAYLNGLEERAARGGDLSHIASVASFFVSRLDTLVDPKLEERFEEGGPDAALATA